MVDIIYAMVQTNPHIPNVEFSSDRWLLPIRSPRCPGSMTRHSHGITQHGATHGDHTLGEAYSNPQVVNPMALSCQEILKVGNKWVNPRENPTIYPGNSKLVKSNSKTVVTVTRSIFLGVTRSFIAIVMI